MMIYSTLSSLLVNNTVTNSIEMVPYESVETQ
jgi:hypothetical protein